MSAKEKSTHSKSVEKMNTHLILVKKETVCAHNSHIFHCQFKKTSYLCIVKRNKILATG